MGRGGYVFADADRRGSAQNRRQRDLEFLAKLAKLARLGGDGDIRALALLLREHGNASDWKQVAIKRAIRRAALASPQPRNEHEGKATK